MTAAAPPPAPSGQPAAPVPPDGLPDVTPAAEVLAAAVIALLAVWAPLVAAHKTDLVGQVRRLLEAGRPVTPDVLHLDPAGLAAGLLRSMVEVAGAAAGQVVDEAAAQGVTVDPVHPSPGDMHQHAGDAATRVTDHLADLAARAAAQAGDSDSVDEKTSHVAAVLDDLDDAGQRQQAGNAMHGASTTARLDTYRQGPLGAIYASEHNDDRTCGPCHEVDGRWLGNTDQMPQVELAYPGGAYGGYIGCLGLGNCRGTIVGVWRPGTEESPVEPGPKGRSLQGSIASGVASEQPLGGGMSADTVLVTFNDGTKAVRKTGRNTGVTTPANAANSEELSATFAARVGGIQAPEVVRDGRDTVYMAYVDGAATGLERYTLPGGDYDLDGLHQLTDSPAGRRLGLFDVTIGNFDRNGGNWLVGADGQLVAIDHGLTWTDTDASPLAMALLTQRNDFVNRLIEIPETGPVTGSRDYSFADIEHLRQALTGMEADFTRLRRHDWYVQALARLDVLNRYAQGGGTVF